VKKVRYLAGAVGAAPAIGMLVAPVPAHAANQAAKTVNLGHRAASVTATHGAAAAAASCTGTTEVHLTTQGSGPYKPSMSTVFWYTKAAGGSGYCVGTVETRWNDTSQGNGVSEYPRIRVWSGKHDSHLAFQSYPLPGFPNGHARTGATTIRRWFGFAYGNPVEVCTAWTEEGQTGLSVAAGPECKTLG
jgi:hypothetical protein